MELLNNRRFQFWEYSVSHGSLLIRSPKDQDHDRNIDILFGGVQYVMLPRHFKWLDNIVEATEEDTTMLVALFGEILDPHKIFVLIAENKKHFVVAAGMKIQESETDIFDSPFE